MKKKNRKWIILGVVVIVLAAGAFTVQKVAAGNNQAMVVSTNTLARMTLTDSISTKGIVESVSKRNVNSTLGYNVQTIFVAVGDRVTEGQILCQLDTDDLELNIAQQKADLEVSQQNSLNQLDNNQRVYEEAIANLQSGSNTQILNAESNKRTAKVNLDNAQKNYDDAVRDRNEGKTQSVMNAESTVSSTKLDLDTKMRDLESNRALLDEGIVTRDTVTQLETAATNALNKYNDALESLASARLTEQRSIESAENNLKTAKTNYDNAVASYNAAKTAADQDLERYKNNIAGSEISANMDAKLIAIEKLEKQLADSTITAPISGTVTAVYAKEGQQAAGLLFVIEDIDHLRVKTTIKEYDAGRVGAGMTVHIRADATGNAQYDGAVTKLNPAAEKNAQGDTNTTGDIEFGAEVSVDTADTLLKVGMNTRLTIIISEKENVFGVPYDAVSTVNGQNVVYTLSKNDSGKTVAKTIPVTTGMETDFYIEIEGAALTDGMQVINDAANLSDGIRVRTADSTDDRALFEQMANN